MMGNYAVKTVLLLLLVVFVFSCGDTLTEFEEENLQDYIRLVNLANGQILDSSDTISFELFRTDIPEEDLQEVAVQLLNDQGDILGSIQNPAPDNKIPFDVDISDLELKDGEYTIQLVLYDGVTALIEKEVRFFYSKTSLNILGIESFPPIIYPGILVELRAYLDIPESMDPYLRWKQDDQYIAEGLLSEGLDTIYWTAPEEDGVYSLSLEMFPVEPLTGVDYPYISSIAMDTELFISKLDKPNHRDLYPEESYFTLFHFAGDTQDTAGTPEDVVPAEDAIPIGKPVLVLEDDDLGYKLDRTSGLLLPSFPFPLEKNSFAPSTLSIGIALSPLKGRSSILNYVSFDESFSFQLLFDDDNRFKVVIKNVESQFLIDSKMDLPEWNRRFLLSLSILPGKDVLTFLWFFDGVQVSKSTIPWKKVEIPSEGTTTIGGKNGFSGIIDELGVYFRDPEGRKSIDPALFRFLLRQKYIEEFVQADGFDGLFLPSSYETEGEVFIDPGYVKIEPEGILIMPEIYLDEDQSEFVFQFISTSEGSIEFYYQEEQVLELPFTLSNEEELMFKFTVDQKDLLVRLPKNTEEEPEVTYPLPDISEGFRLSIRNRGEKELSLDFYTILYNLQ